MRKPSILHQLVNQEAELQVLGLEMEDNSSRSRIKKRIELSLLLINFQKKGSQENIKTSREWQFYRRISK
jgi:hypothetical protein